MTGTIVPVIIKFISTGKDVFKMMIRGKMMIRDSIGINDQTIYYDELMFQIVNPPTVRTARKNVGLPMCFSPDINDKFVELFDKTVAHDFIMHGVKLNKYKQ